MTQAPPTDALSSAAPLQPARAGDAPLDLRETDLRNGLFAGADLADAQLQHACLAGADLAGAVLRGARLTQADLALADLRGADLRGADLSGADLSGADLREARLDGADLADADLGWAQVAGAFGLPVGAGWDRRPDGRLRGDAVATDPDEPAAGLRALQHGQKAHGAGHLGLAERHYRAALAWVPDSDAVRFYLAAVALERGEPARAESWWREALAVHAGADRARVELALLALWRRDAAEARALLAPLLPETTAQSTDRAWLQPVVAALDALDLDAAAAALVARVGSSPAARWQANQPLTPRPQRPTPTEDSVTRLADETWVATERTDLEGILRTKTQPAWMWHSAIARALSIGAMDLAQRAEQRLSAAMPEHRLWGLELKQLDVTAQAFESLVRTRRGLLGTVHSVRWVALGAHGPTARIHCDGGVFFAKRYQGLVRPAGSVSFTHRICRAVAERGFHVPVPLGDRDGDDVLVFGDDLLALYPDVEGNSIRDDDLSESDAGDVGALLGRLHRSAGDLGAGAGRPRGGVRVGTRTLRHRSPANAWLTAMGQDTACAAHFDRHPYASRITSLLEATGRRLRGVSAGCPPGLVHGDFGAGNVLHRKAGGFAIVDWDLCDVDLLVWDLARCIDLLAVSWPSEPGHPTDVRETIAQALVRGYHAERPLARAEQAALPLLIAASRVDLDATVLPMCVRLEPDVAEPVLERELMRLSRAVAGVPEIADLLGGLP